MQLTDLISKFTTATNLSISKFIIVQYKTSLVTSMSLTSMLPHKLPLVLLPPAGRKLLHVLSGDEERVCGADEHLRDVPRLVERLLVEGLVALNHARQVDQLGGEGGGGTGEQEEMNGRRRQSGKHGVRVAFTCVEIITMSP